ncbi:MAG: glycosyltransferase, partial [Candidatus Krumholzibacteria bacterium]|nr:glycosyltransferase [Candidatus Krumholzibacteria bacterium]
WIKSGLPVSECRVNSRWKVHVRYPALLWRYLRVGRIGGILFVPDFRHKDVPLAWALARLSGKKVVFDPLVSRYETKILDRGDAAEGSLQSWHNRNIDKFSFNMPDLVLADTDAHARFYINQFGVPEEKVQTLYIGYDEDLFKESPLRASDGMLKVLFYGTYLPLHGIGTIVESASILRDDPVRFTLVGEGQTYDEVRRRAESVSPGRIEFRNNVPAGELGSLIAGSDVVLGVFGMTPKAAMVIPNKVYQALAVGRPVITSDNPAIRELFRSGDHLLTVPPADARALAESLKFLESDPGLSRRLAETGGSLVRRVYNSKRIAERFADILKEKKIL